MKRSTILVVAIIAIALFMSIWTHQTQTSMGKAGETSSPVTVSLIWPSDGSTISGLTGITAVVRGSDTVSKVEFYLDNVLIGTATNTPYALTFNAATLGANGKHALSAKEFDAVGFAVAPTIFVSTTDCVGITQAGCQRFLDVPPSSTLFAAVNGFANAGLTNGCDTDPTRYCPNNPVTRAQAAFFLIKALQQDTAASSTTPIFTDVSTTYPFYAYIQKLADLNIATECTTGNYCPDAVMMKGQAAVFIIKALQDTTEPSDVPLFDDVPVTHPYYRYIQRLGELNIATQCTAGSYCPDQPLTRAGMAVMFVKAFGIPAP